jgi:hypothetical protein
MLVAASEEPGHVSVTKLRVLRSYQQDKGQMRSARLKLGVLPRYAWKLPSVCYFTYTDRETCKAADENRGQR